MWMVHVRRARHEEGGGGGLRRLLAVGHGGLAPASRTRRRAEVRRRSGGDCGEGSSVVVWVSELSQGAVVGLSLEEEPHAACMAALARRVQRARAVHPTRLA